MSGSVRVFIVDDHAIIREGLQTLLAEETDIEVVGQAANGLEAIPRIMQLQPEVVLMDLSMPQMDGIETLRRLKAAGTTSHVLVLTSFSDDEKVQAAIQAGAKGYLLKDVLKPELLQAIRTVAQGKPYLHSEAQQALIRQATQISAPSRHALLTERELAVLRLIAQGLSNKEIAMTLHLTEGTIKGYVSIMLSKLDVTDRTQAALYAVKHGLADV